MDGAEFDESTGQLLCAFWFESILAKLHGKKLPSFPVDKVPDAEFPLFVTWLKGVDKDLRGCIGTFAEEKISKNIQRYALISAFEDSRFDPLDESEVDDLHCGLSLLCNFTKIDDPLDWEVGKHGIEIDFTHSGRPYSGTFLPEVAEEQGWDQKETLTYLIRKAGCSAKLKDIVNDIECKTYESKKFSMSYSEYVSSQT